MNSQEYASNIDLTSFLDDTGWVRVTPKVLRLLIGAAYQSGAIYEQAKQLGLYKKERTADVISQS